ncbi:hypothetical protein [Myroides sp. DW712]|uniref:hypothetical protein n=1 Tax=Myroides sp. DW712 TaxID=3389800 RepID=UPI003978EDB4
MENNPIQQRMEEFELKYLTLRYAEVYNYLIMRTAQRDWDMLETFYDYMLGIDNEVDDVVVVFESPLYQEETYSKALVEELFGLVFLWNFSEKPQGVEDNYVDWEMDLSLASKKNVAALFVANINAFCDAVELAEDSNIVCLFHYKNSSPKAMLHWLKDLAQLELHPRVHIVISDTFEAPIFNALKDYAPKSTRILEHHFELDQAIKEIAAMGDPEAPDTQYRYHLMQLFEGISKKQEKEIRKHAKICLDIAAKNAASNDNWKIQKMIIYSALATFEYGEKQFQQAVNYINQGLEEVQAVLGLLPNEMVYRLLGQGLLFRGNLYLLLKKEEIAKDDFVQGELYYADSQDYLMQIEALRLIAKAAQKEGETPLRYEALNKGVRLGVKLNATLAQASTYPLLIKDVLATRYQRFISDRELDEIIQPLLGGQWRIETKSVKHIIEKNIIQ